MSEIYQNKNPEEIKKIIADKLAIYKLWKPNFNVMEAHIELRGDKLHVPTSPEYSAMDHYIRIQNRNPDDFKIERYIGMNDGVEIYHFLNLVQIV